MNSSLAFLCPGEMDLDRINAAGLRLCGEHDFRNFCKMDVNNGVINYMRRIDVVRAELREEAASASPYTMCVLTVRGKAFLWHQIRCIVAVLFRIGEGKEEPGVIDELFDVEANPRRPQYNMASEIPLNLFDCEYEGVEWRVDRESTEYVLKQFQRLWTEHRVKADMIRACLAEVEAAGSAVGAAVTHQGGERPGFKLPKQLSALLRTEVK